MIASCVDKHGGRVKQKLTESGRKNMNLSASVFKRLERLKRREEERLDESTSWDRFMSDLADREEERRGEPQVDQ